MPATAPPATKPAPPRRPRTKTPLGIQELLLRYGVHTLAGLDAGLAHTPKSPALVRILIDAVASMRFGNYAYADAALSALLGEAKLRRSDLYSMTYAMRGRAGTSPDILTAICAHPAADPDLVIDAIWSSPSAAGNLARATGDLLPGALDWVRRKVEAGQLPGQILGGCNVDQFILIRETAARWAARTAGAPALAALVATTCFDFTSEDELFAVARAICAPPAA